MFRLASSPVPRLLLSSRHAELHSFDISHGQVIEFIYRISLQERNHDDRRSSYYVRRQRREYGEILRLQDRRVERGKLFRIGIGS